MKRDDVKNLIPGITEEQLQQLMELHGAGINTEKQKATAAVNDYMDSADAENEPHPSIIG